MTTTKCDFCGAAIPDEEETMLYEVIISQAAGYVAESKAEKALLFDAEDVCHLCARKVRATLVRLRDQIRKAKQ